MSDSNEKVGSVKRSDHVVTDPWICLDCKVQFEPSMSTQCPSCFSGNTVYDVKVHSSLRSEKIKSADESSILVEVWGRDACIYSKNFISLDDAMNAINSNDALEKAREEIDVLKNKIGLMKMGIASSRKAWDLQMEELSKQLTQAKIDISGE